MKVIGFTFSKISAEKKKEIMKSTNINTDMKIININEGVASFFQGKKTLAIDYQFKIDWQPDFANIIFEGSLILLMDDENDEELVKNTLESWKEKKLPEELGTNLLKIIFSRCNLKALQLEEYINLPPHLPSPQFFREPVKTDESSEKDSNKKK